MSFFSYAPPLSESPRQLGWRDALVFLLFFLLLWGGVQLIEAMRVPYFPDAPLEIDLTPALLPYYAARSLFRMCIAFAASLIFSLSYGAIAAYNPRAEKVLLPLLDILQSVPVLGFLSVTVTGFMALFPGSLIGLECASIFAIFTGQAWNLAFSFYNSLKTIPVDLRDASTVFGLSRWQRFTKLEVPFAMIGLVWNGMMSFGGGWFFLAASEAITVLGHSFKLPGIGSYMATAVDQGDGRAVTWAIVTMIAVVVLVDQFFWRPVVAWAQRFKFEETEGSASQQSWFLELLRRSELVHWVNYRMIPPLWNGLDRLLLVTRNARQGQLMLWGGVLGQLVGSLLLLVLAVQGVRGGWHLLQDGATLPNVGRVLQLGGLSFLRVMAMVIIATLIWTPVGVWIGFTPRVARIIQPLVQIGASFPANLTFPIVVLFFLKAHIPLNWGSIFLLGLGTQWYILFNVIAGAMAVPSDLREAALVFRLRGGMLWRRLILPAIFPSWVTGAITAAGGAWNATIVAEVASWGNTELRADGLGSYIAQATASGDWPAIVLGIGTMSLFVVLLNRHLWRPLFNLAAQRYRLG